MFFCFIPAFQAGILLINVVVFADAKFPVMLAQEPPDNAF